MPTDFSLSKYTQLCQAVSASAYVNMTLREYIAAASPHPTAILLRHDIDRHPGRALAMAETEHRLGLRATYYFRYTKAVFRPDLMTAIADMGHEIGYHYETLSKAKGDVARAIALFQTELAAFRRINDVRTISMHGRPLSPWDNRRLWDTYDFTDYDILGEAYLSIDYNQMAYYSDTGRTWHPGRHNIRDQVSAAAAWPEVSSTDQLIRLVQSNRLPRLCILTHPNRWSDGWGQWVAAAVEDGAVNMIKWVLTVLRT